jgi:hypothetical protein|nr:MAG TPA: hypothetical protein [Caudoviricetes sp.]
MKKHYETYVEDTDKLISVAGPVLDYKSWYEQYRKLMEEQAQRKYGLYTPTSEGDDDDFPSIPGITARYSALGLTNEQMAANPVWKNLTGNGHDLQMKNFSWKGMSGVGGYVGDFSKWVNNRDTTEIGITKSNSKVIIDVKVSQGSGKNIVFISKSNLGISNNVTIKITSTYPEGVMKFANSASNKYLKLPSNGIITLQDNPEYTSNEMHLHLASADLGQITIEQLPLYPGFILGDGVDDFAVTEKELNFEDTYTVYTAFIPFQNNPTRNMILCGADSKKTFSMQYSSLVYVSFIAGNNYYINAYFVNGLNLFACKRNGNNICIKNLLTNKVVTGTCGDWVENAGPYYLWKNATYASFAKTAIAGQTICNGYFSTDEDDEKVLDWHKKQYPWLFPDQAWTVTGKTNQDEDRATIANITGNGNDLVLSNFGFIEGSGYNEEGEYAGYLVTDGVDDKIVSSVFGMGKDFTIVGDWKFIDNKKSGTGLVKGSSFYIYNTMIGLDLYINSGSVKNSLDGIKSINAACSDGRAYDRNWNEILANTGNVVGSGGMLEVSSSGGRFDRIAFKNLAIYPRILSKDDCIKAYNYLQTLKSK